jgi:methyl halide transferase
LLNQGFTNVTVIDIAPTLVENLRSKFKGNCAINIILGNFFNHQGEYDLILEQTFFCALEPNLRNEYVSKMYELLSSTGTLVGLLFNRTFKGGPPFGGDREEYEKLFAEYFKKVKLEVCHNSIKPRANSELFIEIAK